MLQVCDIADDLQQIYSCWDERLAYQLLLENISSLVLHWSEMVLNIDTYPILERESLTPYLITEPLAAYLEHNKIRSERKHNKTNNASIFQQWGC